MLDAIGSWFVALDAQLQRWLGLPAWVSIVGLVEHVIVGWVLGWLIYPVCSGWATLGITLILAVIHEQAQGGFSDFRRPKPGEPDNGAPYNGILDVATFALGAVIGIGQAML